MSNVALSVSCSGPNKGQVTTRELTAAEIAQREADAAAHEQAEAERLAEEELKAQQKEAAMQKLMALGLSSEEVAALIS